MSIKIGNIDIGNSQIKGGNVTQDKIMLGNIQVWPNELSLSPTYINVPGTYDLTTVMVTDINGIWNSNVIATSYKYYMRRQGGENWTLNGCSFYSSQFTITENGTSFIIHMNGNTLNGPYSGTRTTFEVKGEAYNGDTLLKTSNIAIFVEEAGLPID